MKKFCAFFLINKGKKQKIPGFDDRNGKGIAFTARYSYDKKIKKIENYFK